MQVFDNHGHTQVWKVSTSQNLEIRARSFLDHVCLGFPPPQVRHACHLTYSFSFSPGAGLSRVVICKQLGCQPRNDLRDPIPNTIRPNMEAIHSFNVAS